MGRCVWRAQRAIPLQWGLEGAGAVSRSGDQAAGGQEVPEHNGTQPCVRDRHAAAGRGVEVGDLASLMTDMCLFVHRPPATSRVTLVWGVCRTCMSWFALSVDTLYEAFHASLVL